MVVMTMHCVSGTPAVDLVYLAMYIYVRTYMYIGMAHDPTYMYIYKYEIYMCACPYAIAA